MDKYFVFRKLMDFLSDHAAIVDADMNYCGDTIQIVGENDGEEITLELTIRKKEEGEG